MGHCAPKDFLLAKAKSSYEDNPKIMAILDKQPSLLNMFGYNPNEIMREIKIAKEERERINSDFGAIQAGYRDQWAQWMLKYKAIISNQT